MYCKLLGFDLRLLPEDYITDDWTQQRRNLFLLNPKVKWPLSVDKNSWPTWFNYYDSSAIYYEYHKKNIKEYDVAKKKINVDLKSYRILLDLWQDLEEMKDCFRKHSLKSHIKGVNVAFVLITKTSSFESKYLPDTFNSGLPSDSSIQEWKCLGYDVASDGGCSSGLTNCEYDVKVKKELQKTWLPRLNENGLIKTLHDAFKFVEVSNKRVKEHAPFYVYGLYCEGLEALENCH